MPPRRPALPARDVRCAACGALLAKAEAERISLRRGQLEATFDGTFVASLVCYRASCRRLTVLRFPADRGGPDVP